jgi:hypothetical protein
VGATVDVERGAGQERLSSEMKKSAAATMSSSVAFRPRLRAVAAMIALAATPAAHLPVQHLPAHPVVGQPTGQMQLTVVLSASSTASDSVSPIRPNFDEQ